MAKSVWKALWLTSTEYRRLQEYLMVQKHGGGRMTYKDAAVYHRYTMRHCPHQDRKATGEWVSLPSVRYSKPKRPLPWKEKNMSGVQHPCNVLHYYRKWLSYSDRIFIEVLIVPDMVQTKQVFVSFGADFCLVSTFLYGKTQKKQIIIGVFANYDYLCTWI